MPVGDQRLDLSAKFVPPAPIGLARSRLMDVAAHRVVLVLAPAGHGKTTLLGQLASRFGGTVVWYRIDAADRDQNGLAERLGRTLLKAGLIGTGPSSPCTSFTEIAAGLDAVGRSVLLVFDDFHTIAGSAAEQTLARMIALAPPSLRVLLGARRLSGLDVTALRVYGDVHVVDADGLRFRSWEVERLFREVYHQPLPPEDAATLTQRTGGWAAGLTMFHLLTQGRPPAQRRRALADLSRGSRLVRSYLVREVLGDLPAELREFLRRTSALGVLTGPLCDALLGSTGSRDILEELEQRRLFTTAHDDGRQFRYHQVLLDHLELELTEHLGPAATREWYARAAGLLLEAGEVPAAFRAYARAEDWAAVEQLLHRRGAEVVAGPLGALESTLPAGLYTTDPWLLLARARRLAAQGALTEAVTTFRLAHSVAEDSQLAARCLEEARATALWLPDADPVAHTWQAVVRTATQRNPRALLPAALDLPGADGRLAAGVVALLAGDLGPAADLLRQAATHPDADFGTVALAACAGRVLGMLVGRVGTLDEPGGDLEALLLDAEVAGWPWLSRIGRVLVTAGGPGAIAPAGATVDPHVGDPWGAALARFVDGLGRRTEEPLRAAALRFGELGAPVLAQWATCLGAAVSTGGRVGVGDGATYGAAVARARAMGLRDVPAAVDAWARLRPAPAVTPPRPSPAPPPEVPPLQLRLLGRTEIAIDGVAVDLSAVRPRARSTLRLLALRAGTAVHRDVLVAGLWPDANEEAALRSLQVAVSSLRTVLGPRGRARDRPTLLARNGESYCLQLPPCSRSDVHDFEARLADARARRRDGDRAGERTALSAALGHYGGDLLPEEGSVEWVVAERDRLRLEAARAWCALGRRLGEDGEVAEAVDALRASVRLDAYFDDAWRLLVDLHTRAGNPAAAHAAALEHRQVLAELGLRAEVGVGVGVGPS